MPKLLPIARLGEPILTQKAEMIPITNFSACRPIVQDMVYTLNAQGERLGLAAPQVFISKRIVIYRIPKSIHQRYQIKNFEEVPLTAMINPTWQPLSSASEEGWEACISLPNLMGIVSRHQEILLNYLDLDGNPHQRKAQGFEARVIQHECDHLDGILFIHRMKNLHSLTFEDVKLKHAPTFNIEAVA